MKSACLHDFMFSVSSRSKFGISKCLVPQPFRRPSATQKDPGTPRSGQVGNIADRMAGGVDTLRTEWSTVRHACAEDSYVTAGDDTTHVALFTPRPCCRCDVHAVVVCCRSPHRGGPCGGPRRPASAACFGRATRSQPCASDRATASMAWLAACGAPSGFG